jgi:hypothetical protein
MKSSIFQSVVPMNCAHGKITKFLSKTVFVDLGLTSQIDLSHLGWKNPLAGEFLWRTQQSILVCNVCVW